MKILICNECEWVGNTKFNSILNPCPQCGQHFLRSKEVPLSGLSSDGVIEPCPFCGAESEVELYDDFFDENTQRVTCPNQDCPGAHVWEDSKQDAVSTWNKRAV